MGYVKKDGSIVSDEWMDRIADRAERDELLSDSAVAAEEADLQGDDGLVVPVHFSRSCLEAIEKAAAKMGESRGDFIRSAVDSALLTA